MPQCVGYNTHNFQIFSTPDWPELQKSLVRDGSALFTWGFLLSVQRFHLEGFGFDPIESLVPNFTTQIDPARDSDGFLVARFLHDYGFHQVSERDSAGWDGEHVVKGQGVAWWWHCRCFLLQISILTRPLASIPPPQAGHHCVTRSWRARST